MLAGEGRVCGAPVFIPGAAQVSFPSFPRDRHTPVVLSQAGAPRPQVSNYVRLSECEFPSEM